MSGRSVAELDAVVEGTLRSAELEFEHPGQGRFVVTLPGTRKLRTVVGLTVGEHGFRVEAFVCRQPDENREQLWAWLLQHNARMYGVAYSIDTVGDVYLTGTLALDAEFARLIAAMPGLTRLDLWTAQVGDAALRELSASRSLTELNLGRTPVSDAGLAHLRQMTGLRLLQLQGSKVTEEGVRGLKEALPKCRVEWGSGVPEPAGVPATPPR